MSSAEADGTVLFMVRGCGPQGTSSAGGAEPRLYGQTGNQHQPTMPCMIFAAWQRAAGGGGPYGEVVTFRGYSKRVEIAAGRAEQRQRHPAKNEQLVEPVPLG